MRKLIFTLLAASLSVGALAFNQTMRMDTMTIVRTLHHNDMLRPVTPTYLKGALVSSPWTDNWFVQLSGGATAFIGKPLGCNDLFGRIKPAMSVAVGKWFTPSIGGRLDYGGMQFKDCVGTVQDCQYMRADFLYNVLGDVQTDYHTLPRWSVIPFAGVGMLHNKDNAHKPFAISFGVQAQYRLSDRLSVAAEIGDMFTMQDFDGYGTSHKFGDHLLSIKAGLSVNIGRVGWKRAVDARPYIAQKDLLMEKQGISDKYRDTADGDAKDKWQRDYPKNDYSGLNSLRARMRNRGDKGEQTSSADSTDYTDESGNSGIVVSDSAYIAMMQSGKHCIGAPVYFFFMLGTVNLTDASQKLNLDELARMAKRYGLVVKVTGAADSATGSTDINDALSESRADFIANELISRGVPEADIRRKSNGGIDDFAPDEANRHTKVALYFRR